MLKIREIKVKDLLTYFLLPLIILTGLWLVYGLYLVKLHIAINIISCLVFSVLSYFLLKRFAIGCVLLYKATAPMSVRDACRFEPTCSTYMIMAINKYGLIRGLYKGFRRIIRCKPPNGGIDYP
ncbi:MAG: membrane protein insertion efficiency factor YidD [Clostridia bacterium]|nr:membrane protein insertion efficiency factor YidD [Clostridia bacterium]